jgi:predicted nucleic acid-binding protein
LKIYADSSFFISLLVVDKHSAEAWRRADLHHQLLITPLNRAEIVHAIFMHVFWKKSDFITAQQAVQNLNHDCDTRVFESVELPEDTFNTSINLAWHFGPTLGVRTLDSLHVAAALELNADRFWTFDDRQAQLAEACGLNTKI